MDVLRPLSRKPFRIDELGRWSTAPKFYDYRQSNGAIIELLEGNLSSKLIGLQKIKEIVQKYVVNYQPSSGLNKRESTLNSTATKRSYPKKIPNLSLSIAVILKAYDTCNILLLYPNLKIVKCISEILVLMDTKIIENNEISDRLIEINATFIKKKRKIFSKLKYIPLKGNLMLNNITIKYLLLQNILHFNSDFKLFFNILTILTNESNLKIFNSEAKDLAITLTENEEDDQMYRKLTKQFVKRNFQQLKDIIDALHNISFRSKAIQVILFYFGEVEQEMAEDVDISRSGSDNLELELGEILPEELEKMNLLKRMTPLKDRKDNKRIRNTSIDSILFYNFDDVSSLPPQSNYSTTADNNNTQKQETNTSPLTDFEPLTVTLSPIKPITDEALKASAILNKDENEMVEPGPEQAAKSASEPISEPVSEPVHEPVSLPVSKPVTELEVTNRSVGVETRALVTIENHSLAVVGSVNVEKMIFSQLFSDFSRYLISSKSKVQLKQFIQLLQNQIKDSIFLGLLFKFLISALDQAAVVIQNELLDKLLLFNDFHCYLVDKIPQFCEQGKCEVDKIIETLFLSPLSIECLAWKKDELKFISISYYTKLIGEDMIYSLEVIVSISLSLIKSMSKLYLQVKTITSDKKETLIHSSDLSQFKPVAKSNETKYKLAFNLSKIITTPSVYFTLTKSPKHTFAKSLFFFD